MTSNSSFEGKQTLDRGRSRYGICFVCKEGGPVQKPTLSVLLRQPVRCAIIGQVRQGRKENGGPTKGNDGPASAHILAGPTPSYSHVAMLRRR
jgi:hypothetical protein